MDEVYVHHLCTALVCLKYKETPCALYQTLRTWTLNLPYNSTILFSILSGNISCLARDYAWKGNVDYQRDHDDILKLDYGPSHKRDIFELERIVETSSHTIGTFLSLSFVIVILLFLLFHLTTVSCGLFGNKLIFVSQYI